MTPSASRNIIFWVSDAGIVLAGGKVRKTKVSGWRIGFNVARSVVRDVSPGDVLVDMMF